MTTVYFVRHAEPDFSNHDELSRELTPKGMADSKLVTRFLSDKNIDLIFSSPFKRAVDTLRDFASSAGLEIRLVDDFRERKIGRWLEDFTSFAKSQWTDHDFKLPGGESLREVQTRNIAALNEILTGFEGKTIAIGTHGTALSTILTHYDKSFGYADFERIKDLMPWVVRLTFNGTVCTGIQPCDLPAKEDPDAQYKLGMMYVYGDGVPNDYEKAVQLLTSAASQGHVEATYNLAICYHYGFGTQIDLKKAFELYMSSAEKGYAKGKHLIGRFYYFGWYVKQDYTEAIKCFEEADRLNDPSSRGFDSCYLGACYELGLGVEPDAEKAKAYFDKAVSVGGDDAKNLIKKLLK